MSVKSGVSPRISELWSDALPNELLAKSLYIRDQHSILSYLRKTSKLWNVSKREYACVEHVIVKTKDIIPSSQIQTLNVFLKMQLK